MPKEKHSRKMKPYAWTPDGESPHKQNSGRSGEDTIGISYKQNKKFRKEAQRVNQLENKRARKFYKDDTKSQLDNLEMT